MTRELVTGLIVGAFVLGTAVNASAEAVMTLHVLPGSSGTVALEATAGPDVVLPFTDDGDGLVTLPTDVLFAADYGRIEWANGAHLAWCNGYSIEPLPGDIFEKPGFVTPAGPDLMVLADLVALADAGVTFSEGQRFEVVGGGIGETPLVQIKDASEVVDAGQLLDPAFVTALPDYTGPALYRAAGSILFVPEPASAVVMLLAALLGLRRRTAISRC